MRRQTDDNRPGARWPYATRGYLKQLVAEIIGDQSLQEDGRHEVQQAARNDARRDQPNGGVER